MRRVERRRVEVEILGTPEPGLAVWRALGDPRVAGDLAAHEVAAPVRAGDRLVLDVRREGFRWHVEAVVDVDLVAPPARAPKPRRPHAHPARPPGTVLIAWLPFGSDPDGPGKHRPCVVLHSPAGGSLRVRPLYDAGSALARREGGVRLRSWGAAGLDKPSVAVAPVEVPVARCEQTLGRLSPDDAAALGIRLARRG